MQLVFKGFARFYSSNSWHGMSGKVVSLFCRISSQIYFFQGLLATSQNILTFLTKILMLFIKAVGL